MSLVRRLAAVVLAVTVLLSTATVATASPLHFAFGAPLDPWLASVMWTPAGDAQTVVVHGTDATVARTAAIRAGMTPLRDMKLIGATISAGDRWSILRVSAQPGVTYVEGNRSLEYFLNSSHKATRGAEASQRWRSRKGVALDGRGVSVAVIDTGVDPTHPFFQRSDGKNVVVANLKNVCASPIAFTDPTEDFRNDPDTCFVDVGLDVDTDTASVGGHGTHVNGIVAGQPTTLADGARVAGAAPGARIVSLSVGAGIAVINAELAMEWVLEHHEAPCGPDVSKAACPPIKVINNSWGPSGGGDFNPDSAIVKLQRKLAAEGVVTVWANGNDGDLGSSANHSNPPGQDPTGGIISVASYFDQNTGTRRGTVSEFSSRGHEARPKTWPDISAPGEQITSACRPYLLICSSALRPRDGSGDLDMAAFNTISGTSMAAPHVAGIVAQLVQAKRPATPAQIEMALKSSAYRFTDGAKYKRSGLYLTSYDKGTGLVDVVAAVTALQRKRR